MLWVYAGSVFFIKLVHLGIYLRLVEIADSLEKNGSKGY